MCGGCVIVRGGDGVLVQQHLQGLDVVDGMAEDGHLGDLLDGSCRGDGPLELLESVVDGLDPVALPGVATGDLDVLGRGDGVAVHRVDSH